MPIYEYACGKCDREFEVKQRITDEPIKTCPHCKSKKVKRLISRTSFVLKGSGWYSDLYSSSGAKDDKGESGDGKAESDSKDSKSESKKDSKSTDTSKAKDKPSAKSKGKGGKAAKR